MIKNKTSHNNEAFDAYRILKKQGELNKTDVLRALDSLEIYMNNLCNSITERPPKRNFIYQWIFTNEFEKKDLDKYYKVNIFVATESLGRIISICRQREITYVLRRLLIDYICDLKEFVNYFDKSQNYEWLMSNTNSHITNFYYDLATNVFYEGKPGKQEQEHLALSSSTPFIIRQSIEYKIKRILGIEHIELQGKIQKTTAKVYFKALRNNKEFYKTRKFDIEFIEKIHSWTHLYIHGGFRPRPWLTENSLNYIKELFYSGETSQEQSLSLYAGIEILETDLESLLEKTQEFIKKELGQAAKIVWLTKPELAYIKNTENK